MKAFFLVFLFGITYSVMSQNFQIVYSDKKSVFSNSVSENDFCQAQAERYFAVSIDSVKNINGNQVFYSFNTIERNTENNGQCAYKTTSNWAGHKFLIAPNGDNMLFNKKKDTILIKAKASIGAKWKLYKEKDGKYFEAEIVSKVLSEVLAQPDSLKTIRINYKDVNGDPLDHILNGKEIVISKNYGAVQLLSISEFPNDVNYFTLAGLSNPKLGVQDITAREVFDYNVTEEFHIEAASNSGPFSFNSLRERRIILEKYISVNNDTLIYKIQRTQFHIWDNYQTQKRDSSSLKDTISEKIIISEYKNLNRAPLKFETIPELNTIGCACLGATTSYNDRLVKTVELGGVYPSGDSCYNPIMDYFGGSYYIDGLGGEYYSNTYGLGYSYKSLVYYKKGSETWGTPIDFKNLLSIQSSESLVSSISPNPFKEDIKFELKQNGSYELELSTIYGSVIKKISFEGSDYTLRNEGWKGVYVYKIMKDNVVVGSGKVVAY